MDVQKLKLQLLEEEQNDRDASAAAAWRAFKSGTTSHGLPHLLNAQGWFKRLLWLFSTLFCLLGLAFNCYQLCTKYLSYNVDVSVKLKHTKSIEFPAVTICNNNPIKKSVIDSSSSMYHVVNNYKTNVIKSCNTSYYNTSTTTSSPYNYTSSNSSFYYTQSDSCLSGSGVQDDEGNVQRKDYIFQDQFLEVIAGYDDDVKKIYGHYIFPLLYECNFGGTTCDWDDFKHFFNNYHGNCYSFNAKLFNGNNNKTKVSKKSGSRYGLNILFDLEQYEYVGEITKSAGLRVVIHDPSRMPFPEDEGILVKPNTLTNIGITLTRSYKLNGVYGDCYDEKDGGKHQKNIYMDLYSAKYSEKSCHYTCLADKIMDKCGCFDIKFPTPKKGSVIYPCSVENKTQVSCRARVWALYDDNELECAKKCTVPCRDTTYNLEVTSEMWPSDHYLITMKEMGMYGKMARDIADLHSNDYGMVNIYVKDFTYTEISESPSYEWQDFVSDLGGILGLYIGFSILTIVEFVELFIDLTRLGIMNLCCKKKPNKVAESGDNVVPMETQVAWEDPQNLPTAPENISYLDIDKDRATFQNEMNKN